MFLVDTNVISAAAPSKGRIVPELAAWMDKASPHLFLSAVTASEVLSGIARAERMGAARKAADLREWWHALEHLYADRILPFDLAAARLAGTILDNARAHAPGFEDIAIAATARAHGLTVLTANEKHFVPLGVAWANPFKGLPVLPGV
ncbi:MAG: type II toxin-antitoxin system VapC family toxin [Pseudaminobacter sp.]|nr:type II toxin-antitoxin system VapC family toxin [Pseudaminobacter sp.]